MNVRVEWSDTYVPRFTYTEEVVGGDVWATFAEARRSALASARDERDQWAACVRSLRGMTKAVVHCECTGMGHSESCPLKPDWVY